MTDRTYAICRAVFWTLTVSAFLILTISAVIALITL
jgi:hypothetical protein